MIFFLVHQVALQQQQSQLSKSTGKIGLMKKSGSIDIPTAF